MGTVSGADERSPATAGTPDSARSDRPRSRRGRSGRRTYDRNPTTRSRPAPENPAETKQKLLFLVNFQNSNAVNSNQFKTQ